MQVQVQLLQEKGIFLFLYLACTCTCINIVSHVNIANASKCKQNMIFLPSWKTAPNVLGCMVFIELAFALHYVSTLLCICTCITCLYQA